MMSGIGETSTALVRRLAAFELVEDFVQSYRWATMRDGVPSNQFVATLLIRISQALTQRRIGTSYS